MNDIVLYILNQIPIPNSSTGGSWLRNLYVAESYTIEGKNYNASNVLDYFYVSDYAFMDDKKEGEEDKDACWKCNEVLEAICQFLGMTCVQWGEDIYFIDYDYLLKNYDGFSYYSCYAISSGSYSQVKLDNSFNITHYNQLS